MKGSGALGIFETAFVAFVAVVFIVAEVNTVIMRRRLGREPEKIAVGRKPRGIVICQLVCGLLLLVMSVWSVYDDNAKIEQINSGYYDEAYRIRTDSGADTETLRAELLKKPLKQRSVHKVSLIVWSVLTILSVQELIEGRRSYITAKGVYTRDSFLPVSELSYHMYGETLELYRERYTAPIRYSIIGEKERLLDMLAENYNAKADKN